MLLLVQTSATAVPDNRLLFVVSVIVVASVVVFTGGVIITLLRRSDRRRAEEEKLAAMGTATARILHQIKNPLQTIVLHADILRDDRMVSEPAVRREVSDAIVSESQRLVAMLDELSVYASGAQRALNRLPVGLHELLRQVAGNEASEAETGVAVEIRCAAPALVYADAYYLRQALENLVRNAHEAMQGQKGARLKLALERDGPHAVVTVSDNGPGIPPEKLARVFEPFVSTKGKGMGLGLAICREIVEAHAGRLEVESTPGTGTTFTIRLPVAELPATQPSREPVPG
jgi:two-component system, NtrC family, sensor kinase